MVKAASVVMLRRGRAALEILLVRRTGLEALAGTWAFPGGKVEARDGDGSGAEPAAARRELAEETGLELGDETALLPCGRWRLWGWMVPAVEIACYAAPAGEAADVALPEGARWVVPAGVLAEFAAGAPMAPSVRLVVEALADLAVDATPEAAAHHLEARFGSSVHGEAEDPADPLAAAEILPWVRLVPLRTPTLPPATHTNCWILGPPDDCVVVDPASPYEDEQDRLEAILAHHRLTVRAIWLTHHHADHVGGAMRLKTRLGVPCLAHRISAGHLEDGLVDDHLEDGESVVLGRPPRQRWVALWTPGHTRGHLCFHAPDFGAVVAGDLVAGVGTVVVDPPDGNMRQYFASIHRLMDLPAESVLPAHGPASAEAAALLGRYIAHREAREAAIVSAIGDGATTPAEMVARVYTDVPAALHPLAERNVRAHLEKLLEEGRVSEAADVYRLVG